MDNLAQLFAPYANKQVFIAGGTGFIGKHLLYHLVQAGAYVTVYSRSIDKAKRIVKQVSPMQAVNVVSTLPNMSFDYVFNLAGENIGEKRWSVERKHALLSSRVNWTYDLYEWFKQNTPPKVLINASAIGYYGVRAEQILTEKDQPIQEFMSELCQAWEKAADTCKDLGVRVIKARFGVVMGESGALPKMIMPFKYYLGGKIGTGFQYLSWVDINDCVAALAFLGMHHEEGAFNITSPAPIQQKDFALALGKILNKPAFFSTPSIVLECMYGEMSRLITGGQRVLPKRLLDAGFKFQYASIEQCLEHVGRMTQNFTQWTE